ncbi:hypothetical protein KQH50_03390 [bacterium]|nr:hypothetical protein [bacterium]
MLSETTKLDIVAQAPDGGIVLAISAHEDWSKNPYTLDQLDEKLRNYVYFIDGGQYEDQFGDKPVSIQIMTAYPLSRAAEKLVKRVSRSTGIEIKTEVMGVMPNPFKK